MDSITKIVACFALLLASLFFISITSIEQSQRNLKLQQLSNDAWVNQTIAKAFPGFPVIARLEKVIYTEDKLREGIKPNWAEIVVSKLGWQPEYYRLFTVYQRRPVDGDLYNHYHIGFITSELEVCDIGLDYIFD
jgi:hypothetical protein